MFSLIIYKYRVIAVLTLTFVVIGIGMIFKGYKLLSPSVEYNNCAEVKEKLLEEKHKPSALKKNLINERKRLCGY